MLRPLFCLISLKDVDFGASYVKLMKVSIHMASSIDTRLAVAMVSRVKVGVS